MITLTPQALDQVKQLIQQEQQPGAALRVGVKGGGCSGLSYMLGFDANVQATDHAFEQDGLKIVVDPKSHLYLDGTTIDYHGGLGGAGFAFQNPNAQKSCGCGSSFTPEAGAGSQSGHGHEHGHGSGSCC